MNLTDQNQWNPNEIVIQQILRIYNAGDVTAGENHRNKRINLLKAIKHTWYPDSTSDILDKPKMNSFPRQEVIERENSVTTLLQLEKYNVGSKSCIECQ